MKFKKYKGPYNCPFCGSVSKIVPVMYGKKRVGTYVCCSDTECVGWTCRKICKKKQDAIDEWNARAEW